MKKLWFKAKTYGWGWYPVSWEGWLVTFLFAFGLVFSFTKLMQSQYVFLDIIAIIVLIVLMIYIGYKTGERPRWRWGK